MASRLRVQRFVMPQNCEMTMASEQLNYVKSKREMNEKVDAFLSDIEEVCRSHGMSISHEDHHGAFIATDFSEENLKWLKACGMEFKTDKSA